MSKDNNLPEILQAYDTHQLAQDITLVAGEAVSYTQRGDLGRAVANLLSLAHDLLEK